MTLGCLWNGGSALLLQCVSLLFRRHFFQWQALPAIYLAFFHSLIIKIIFIYKMVEVNEDDDWLESEEGLDENAT